MALARTGGSAAAMSFNNSLASSSSVGSAGTVSLAQMTDAGLYNVQGGTTIGGTVHLTGDVEGLGAYLNVNDNTIADLSPGAGPNPLAVGSLIVGENSSLTGTRSLTSAGPFTWYGGGTISVPSIDAKGGGDLQGGASWGGLHSYLDGTALTLHGSSTFEAFGDFQLKNGASITNLGAVAAPVAANYIQVLGAGTFVNQSTITKTGGGALYLDAANTVNAGSIAVQGGGLDFGGGTNSGTVTIENGASLYASPYVQTAGATVLNGGTINAGPININSG